MGLKQQPNAISPQRQRSAQVNHKTRAIVSMLGQCWLRVSEWILFYIAFCTIMAISWQKKARSRDYALLLLRITSMVLYIAQYHRQHCTLNAFVRFFVCLSVCPPARLFVCSFVRSFVRSFVCLYTEYNFLAWKANSSGCYRTTLCIFWGLAGWKLRLRPLRFFYVQL